LEIDESFQIVIDVTTPFDEAYDTNQLVVG